MQFLLGARRSDSVSRLVRNLNFYRQGSQIEFILILRFCGEKIFYGVGISRLDWSYRYSHFDIILGEGEWGPFLMSIPLGMQRCLSCLLSSLALHVPLVGINYLFQ